MVNIVASCGAAELQFIELLELLELLEFIELLGLRVTGCGLEMKSD
jgi:hypothetical protein